MHAPIGARQAGLLVASFTLGIATLGCGGESSSPAQRAPTAAGVAIVDDDGGDALEGDDLTGQYTYADADGDAEGTPAFRWLRDGQPIAGAVASTYTLVAADVAARIEFEVTPAALTGESPGMAVRSADLATGTPPVVAGQARYHDVDANGEVDAGDTLVVPFDQPVVVGTASAGDFTLPVPGDVLAVTSIAAGPGANEVTLTLDDASQLKARQVHPAGTVLVQNDASGIDVAAGMAADAVESLSGKDALASTAIDVIPAYVTGPNAFAPGGSKWVEAGDLDRDGDLDAIVVVPSGNAITAWLQANDGSFDATGFQIGFGDDPIRFVNRLALGDLDGDGDLDVVTARLSSNRVWMNRIGEGGLYQFEATMELGSASTESVALGDIDGDGDLDVVAANDGGNRVWKNNGAGVFTDTGQSLGSVYSISVALGDVDRDGDLDAVFGNATAGDTVWLNGGSGVFTGTGQSLGTTSTWAVALGDLDRDGHLDLALAKTSGGNEVWFNDGSGGFDASGVPYGSGVSRDVAIADHDGDGDLDLIFADDSGGGIRIFHNGGNGFFANPGTGLGGEDGTSLALGDVDRDGDVDLLVAHPGSAGTVHLGSLSGAWGSATFVDSGQALGSAFTQEIGLGDVDGDGDDDLVVANFDGANRVWLWNGTAFADSGQALGADETRSVALGDLDEDGDLDIAFGNTGADTIWLNDGTGSFADSGQSLGVDISNDVDLGDLDGDGDLDLVAATPVFGTSTGINRVWKNNGAGVFSSTGQALGSNYSVAVALGDVDHDGDLDMAVGNVGANAVWLNDGTGAFSDTGQSLGSATTLSVALGRLDRDNNLDLVAGNRGSADIVYENPLGDGDLNGSWAMGNYETTGVALGDIDGDGDIDVVTAITAEAGAPDRVWLNSSLGTFADSGQTIGMEESWTAALVDVDADGDLDLVVGVRNGADKVYRNE